MLSVALTELKAERGSFADDVHSSVVRVLSIALVTLRRIHGLVSRASQTAQAYPELLFPVEPTMATSAEAPSLGLLVGVQLFALHDLQRRKPVPSRNSGRASTPDATSENLDEEREVVLADVVESALQLSVLHAARLIQRGALSDGVRDELRKRLHSVLNSLRRLYPSAQVIHGAGREEIIAFIENYL